MPTAVEPEPTSASDDHGDASRPTVPSAVTPDLVAAVTERLRRAGCVAAEEEAAELLAAVPDEGSLDACLRRREDGEPLAWITGTVRFCGRPLQVASGVYVPRWQTEELARRAAAVLPAHGAALDLCTGAGAVAAHLKAEVPTACVLGVDVDVRAARCARRNGVPTLVADLDAPLRPRPTFDVVTAVAPYVPTGALALLPLDVQRHEPGRALDGGADGLDVVRRVIAAAGALLRPGGWLLVEVGGDQHLALASSFPGFDAIEAWEDDEGDVRGVAAQLLGSCDHDVDGHPSAETEGGISARG
jgi:release factor glutamine methyltransferase